MYDEEESGGKHVTSKTPASDERIRRADNLSLATNVNNSSLHTLLSHGIAFYLVC